MNKSILILAGAVAVTCVGFFLWAPAPAPVSILAAPQEPAALNEVPPVVRAVPLSAPEAALLRQAHRPAAVAASEPARPPLAGANLEPRPVVPPVRAAVAPPAGEAPARSPTAVAHAADDREETAVQRQRVSPAAPGQPSVQSTVAPPPLPAVVDLDVPSGGRLPLALVESGEALSREQITAVDATATDFVQAVLPGAPGSGAVPMNPKALWSRAQRQADERYRLLFGNQAADQAAARSASEAGAAAPPQTR